MSDFLRIKKAIQEQKEKALQAKAKIETLNKEKERLLDEAEQILGSRPASLADLEQIQAGMREDITNKIQELKSILDEEGVSY